MTFTIEYYGRSQRVRVYDGKPGRRTELLLGCPASPPAGAIKVKPTTSGFTRYLHRLADVLGDSRSLTLDVTRMAAGPADFSLSRFAARAADVYTAGNRGPVRLDDDSAKDWGYIGPAEAQGPSIGVPADA